MKTIIKVIKTLWATLKDPHLLSSRPHHGEDMNKYCPDCGDYIMPLDWCGCTDPTDANYKGKWNICSNCDNTRMKCTCDANNWYCPECETWQSKERTWENEEFVNESDGDDIPNYKCNKCILGE